MSRARLRPTGEDGSEYINASFVDVSSVQFHQSSVADLRRFFERGFHPCILGAQQLSLSSAILGENFPRWLIICINLHRSVTDCGVSICNTACTLLGSARMPSLSQLSQEVHTRLSKLALPAIQCRSRSLEPLQRCQQVGFKFFCRLNTSSYHRENSLYSSR